MVRYETIQVSNFAGYFIFCGLDMTGDNDGGFALLSSRLLDIFGKFEQHYEKVSRDLVSFIKSELTKNDYYVLRLGEENYTFFNKINEFSVFESSPIIAEKIASKKIQFGFNREFEIHLRILSYKK
jgi:hypothetical protein